MSRAALGAAALLLAGASGPSFVDVTETAGIRTVNVYGGVETKRYILETTGTGAAFFDYDADGDEDLFLVNGARLDEAESPSNALYRNRGDGTFEDVTRASRLEHRGWGQGAAASDVDNDGDLDLYVTYYGPSLLYRNEGDGTFAEKGASAGVAGPLRQGFGGQGHAWGTSAAFADYDQDGAVDLFVASYVDFDPAKTPGPGGAPNCFFMGLAVMCGPTGLAPAKSVLYRGLGDGKFEDVSGSRSGVAVEPFYSLGAVWGDVDNDGDVDLYVANDQTPNNLYRNDGRGRFTEIALDAGVAYNEDGRAQAGMGVDLGDYDNDGWLDIHVTNFSHDNNGLYRNEGAKGYFRDVSYPVGIGEVTFPYLGWGTAFYDFDRDGYLDLFVANGHVYPEVRTAQIESTYAQRNLLFLNRGGARFEEVGRASGPGLAPERVGRGAAFADYDDDGDVDVLVANMNALPSLLRNDAAAGNHWVGVRLIGVESTRDALGARVTLRSGGLTQVREVKSGASYLSQSDLRVFFGLGREARVDGVEIRWPRGRVQALPSLPVDRYTTVVEGR